MKRFFGFSPTPPPFRWKGGLKKLKKMIFKIGAKKTGVGKSGFFLRMNKGPPRGGRKVFCAKRG